jgi:hypothetical protein
MIERKRERDLSIIFRVRAERKKMSGLKGLNNTIYSMLAQMTTKKERKETSLIYYS